LGYARRAVKPVKLVDTSRLEDAIKTAASALPLKLSGPHNLFNPVKWQKKPDGSLIKIETGDEVGPGAMTITNITPLNLVISYDKPSPNPGAYVVSVTREGAENRNARRKKITTARMNEKTDNLFSLVEVKGPADDPAELVLEMLDTKERVSVFKDKPFMRLEGYEADLKYTVDGKTFPNQRVGSRLSFGGEDYNVVAISSNEVVVSAVSNEKKYTIRQLAAR